MIFREMSFFHLLLFLSSYLFIIYNISAVLSPSHVLNDKWLRNLQKMCSWSKEILCIERPSDDQSSWHTPLLWPWWLARNRTYYTNWTNE